MKLKIESVYFFSSSASMYPISTCDNVKMDAEIT